jgi:H+-transporting ATPase
MLALLEANPRAFGVPCNANSPLHVGEILRVPTLSEVKSISRAQAGREFERQLRESVVFLLIFAIIAWHFRHKRPVEEPAAPGAKAPAGPADDFEKLSVEEAVEALGTSPEQGLSAAEAASRLAEYGPNALEEKRVGWPQRLLRYFWGPIPWMIEAAAVMSIIIGDWNDFVIITSLLVFNAIIGFREERSAANALAALKGALALKARIRRDGQWHEVETRDLVPGDIVRLRLGDIIPADVELVEGEYLSIDQAALTGESLPVSKRAGDMAYSSSVAKQGEMVAAVTGTGANTFFGRTAKLVESAGAQSHFQKAVLQVGNFLIFSSILLALVLVSVELFRETSILRLIPFVLILVVASIPVAMPAVLSVTMALGALALSKMKAIVSKLQSIEEMAGVDILCSDKTGTLTQNKITLGGVEPFGDTDEQDLILAGALASKAENNDVIDLAVIGGLEDRGLLARFRQDEFLPFDPVKKRTEATVEEAGGQIFRVTKGAPQVILDLSEIDEATRTRAEEMVKRLAAKGLRTIGVARADNAGRWRFLGILSILDPPREDSKSKASDYGIDVKMVTGDNTAIAREISGQLGIGSNINAADKLFGEGAAATDLSDEAARRIDAELRASVHRHQGARARRPPRTDHVVPAAGRRGASDTVPQPNQEKPPT